MQPHPNQTLVLDLFAAFERSDLDAVQARICPDASWHFPGRRGALAGSHQGWDSIVAFLINVQALTEGTFHAELIDVVANDEHVVVLFHGHAQRDGKKLSNPTCLRIQIRDGMIAELWEFVWDLEHVEDFWS